MSNKWLTAFRNFVGDIRIKSKEVRSTDPRGVPLVLWESQKRFLGEVGGGLDNGIHIFNCLKSRQLGATTVSLAIDVFWPAVHDNLIGCVVSDTEKNSEKNRATITAYVNSFDQGYFGGSFDIVTNNRKMIQFSNGSRLDFLIAGVRKKSTAWGEGEGYTLIHCTELASYADAEGLKSLEEGFAQTNPARLMINESTAKGYNHWRDRWRSGLDKPLTERSFFIGWWSNDLNRIARSDPRFAKFGRFPASGDERELIHNVHVLYDYKVDAEQLAWIRWKQSNAGQEQDLLEQNQPWTADQAFVQSGRSFFQMHKIQESINEIINANLKGADDSPFRFKGYRYEVDGDFFSFRMEELEFSQENLSLVELKVWEEPVKGGRYVIGYDPAYGRTEHKDGNAITVWRCFADRLVEVAEYVTDDVDLKYASWVLFHLCAAYGDVMANVELTGPGRLVMEEFDHLRQLLDATMNRPKVEERNWQDAGANARWYMFHRVDSPGAGYLHNTAANTEDHEQLMHGLRGAYVFGELTIRSLRMLGQMRHVVIDETGHIGSPESSNPEVKDDLPYSAGLAVMAWKKWVKPAMIFNGETYERVMKEEAGEISKAPRLTDSMVSRFLAHLEAEANKEPPRGTRWQIESGLV